MTLAETEGGANQAEGGAGAGDHQDYQLISDEGSHRNTRLLFLAPRVLTTAGFIKTSKQRKLSLPGFTRLAALSQYVQGSLWTNTALVTDIPLLGRRNHFTAPLFMVTSSSSQVLLVSWSLTPCLHYISWSQLLDRCARSESLSHPELNCAEHEQMRPERRPPSD